MTNIEDNLARVRERIRRTERAHGRAPGSVQLLAVSKTQPVAALRTALDAGQTRFGESYVQEALDKISELEGLGIEWHFIGPIQSNKTKAIAAHFDWVHSIDRLKTARRLSEQRPGALADLNVCLQVNVSGESTKSGLDIGGLAPLADAVGALPRLRLRGLMAIPAPSGDFHRQREPFRRLRQAFERLRQRGLALDTLSMGMTADMEAAIAEGATMVRIGTAVFGTRRR
jgi:pyridoxal phosphate enzyme (YggS family)